MEKIHVLIRFEDDLNDCEIEMHATETDIFHCIRDILDGGYIITAIKEVK